MGRGRTKTKSCKGTLWEKKSYTASSPEKKFLNTDKISLQGKCQRKIIVQLENSLPPPHISQLWYVTFSKFNFRITACYVTRLFWVVTRERIGTVGIVSWLIWVQTRMIVDRKKSIMRTFKVKSACGNRENQLGMFTWLGFTCYQQLTAARLVSLINWVSDLKYTSLRRISRHRQSGLI